jgi:hypothetical protein
MPESRSASSRARLAATVTLAVGLIFVAAGVEALAAFDACVADPACLPDAAAMTVGAFFAVLTVGIALAVAGTWLLAVDRSVPRFSQIQVARRDFYATMSELGVVGVTAGLVFAAWLLLRMATHPRFPAEVRFWPRTTRSVLKPMAGFFARDPRPDTND